MWIPQILSAIIGLSAGMLVAAGLFSFITGLGVISDFADRTHTGEHVMLYEDAIVVGGILGNLLFVFKIHIPGGGCRKCMLGIYVDLQNVTFSNGIGRDAGSISNLCAQGEAGAMHSVGDSGNCTR